MYTITQWLTLSENIAATVAVRRMAACLPKRQYPRALNPLFIHGPAGTGKTHLVSALAGKAIQQCPDRIVTLVSASDWATSSQSANDDSSDKITRSCQEETELSDLTIIEDVQHLPARATEALVQAFDARLARRLPMVFTATLGPGRLTSLPARLTSRLAGGLVVGLEPLAPPGRFRLLQHWSKQQQLDLSEEVLAWLAESAGSSGRRLRGIFQQVKSLSRLNGRQPDLATIAAALQKEAKAAVPTVECIAQRVSRYFQVEPAQLQSQQRGRHILLPRQVSMYLVRQLTQLSLEQIGSYFGGRDHSTVLHACRKVEASMTCDVSLSRAIRELHADLA